jgi:hypothetical protein
VIDSANCILEAVCCKCGKVACMKRQKSKRKFAQLQNERSRTNFVPFRVVIQ